MAMVPQSHYISITRPNGEIGDRASQVAAFSAGIAGLDLGGEQQFNFYVCFS